VDLKDQSDKTIQSLLLGKKHMQKSNQQSPLGDMGGDSGYPDGRYVKVNGNSDSVALISDALSNLEPKPEQWLNKDFFRVEKVRSISVSGPAVTNSWKIVRDTENGEWKLTDAKAGEQLDASKSSSAANALGSPSFTDVKTDAKPDQNGLDKPTVVTLDTFDDFAYTVNVGTKTNDAYPLTVAISAKIATERTPGKDEKPDDKTRLDKEFKEKQKKLEDKLAQEKACEKWVYLVSGWTLEPLFKDRAQLLVEKKEEPKKDDKGVPTAQAPKLPEPLPPPTATDPPEKN
jgi:hypothetical protein